MKYLLKGTENEELTSNVLPECGVCFALIPTGTTLKIKCPADGHFRRRGRVISEFGSASLCSFNEDDLNSSRIFHSRMDSYLSVIEHVSRIKTDIIATFNKRLDRVTHNLTSLNAHCIQEVFDLVSQDTLTKNISQQIKAVQDAMRASPDKAAKTFLRIAKNNLAMKAEFVATRFLDPSVPRPALREHVIKKVVLNVLHAFFQDFNDHNVRVDVEESPAKVLLDYDTFHVALYHIIDNATKYVMPRSKLIIRFVVKDSRVKVVFEMLSIPITRDEHVRICEEGFSGKLARDLQLSGHGIGMFRTKLLLEVNNGKLLIKPNVNPSRATKYNGIHYQYNIFEISLRAAV